MSSPAFQSSAFQGDAFQSGPPVTNVVHDADCYIEGQSGISAHSVDCFISGSSGRTLAVVLFVSAVVGRSFYVAE